MKEILKMIKKKEKGIFYYNNGDREMGDYLNNNRIGMHVILSTNGEIASNFY